MSLVYASHEYESSSDPSRSVLDYRAILETSKGEESPLNVRTMKGIPLSDGKSFS